jgi:hypothetical protein
MAEVKIDGIFLAGESQMVSLASMPMTFDQLRIKLGGGPIKEDKTHFAAYCDIPVLPVDSLASIPGLEIIKTDFPGCFRFMVPIVEGAAVYTGVVEVGRNPKAHGKGTLELSPRLD